MFSKFEKKKKKKKTWLMWYADNKRESKTIKE
jgi:hypothetical protein